MQRNQRTSLVVQWLRLHTPSVGVLGLIPVQGTRPHVSQPRAHMPQLRSSRARNINKCLKICCDKELQFSDSVCQYITFLSFVYFCFFVSGRRALLTFLIRIMLMASFSFCLSGKAFISPSYLNDNVAG